MTTFSGSLVIRYDYGITLIDSMSLLARAEKVVMADGTEFNAVAEKYHQLRPDYSPGILNACVEYGELAPGDHLLEIGPGTGIATRAFAERGFRVTAVEPAPYMMRVARRTLASFEGQVTLFENDFLGAVADGQLEGPYDGAYVATAWRFINPKERVVPALHKLIRPAGKLAIMHNVHLISDGEGGTFYPEVLRILAKYRGAAGLGTVVLPRLAEIKPVPLDEQYFRQTHFRLERGELSFTANNYLDYIGTNWEFLELPGEAQAAARSDLQAYLETEHGDTITIPRASSLLVAERVG